MKINPQIKGPGGAFVRYIVKKGKGFNLYFINRGRTKAGADKGSGSAARQNNAQGTVEEGRAAAIISYNIYLHILTTVLPVFAITLVDRLHVVRPRPVIVLREGRSLCCTVLWY